MNKTVRDAAVEYEAEWPFILNHMAVPNKDTNSHRVYEFVEAKYTRVNEYFVYVCSREEFNTYVDSLSHHAGKELFQQYLASDKTLLEKECKSMDIDYTSEEFWKDAPEGATHYGEKKEDSARGWYAINKDKSYQFMPMGGEMWHGDVSKTNISGRAHYLHARPQPKPVFTQEMYERNELPPIGSEYLDEDGQLCKALLHYSSFVVGEMLEHISIQQYPVLSTSRNDRVEMITPPIELIDGECYQFDCEVGTRNGVYSFSDNRFIGLMLKVQTNVCTNIKPLTVDKS